MRLLFITQYFYPETFRGNDVVFYLAERGFKVTVLTAIPNYPHGKYYIGYGLFRRSYETTNGIKIIRVPVIPRGRSGKIGLALNYSSYMFFGAIYSFFLSLFNKYDVILAQQLSPATSVLPGLIVKRLKSIPLLIWVLDLWPESIQSVGGTNNKVILNILNCFMKHVYMRSERILISSKGFASSINSKGPFGNKIIYFPNWAESINTANDKSSIPALPSGFRIVYAGNIGEAQDFEAVMQAVSLVRHEFNIKFIFIGEGRKYNWLRRFVVSSKLTETVTILGRYPQVSMPAFFKQADVMLLSLKDDIVLNKTAPAKLQAYMSCGKPVLGMLNGDGSDIIIDADCGLVAPAGDFTQLAANVLRMKNMPAQELSRMGHSGLLYSEENFNRKKCLSHLQEIILRTTRKN